MRLTTKIRRKWERFFNVPDDSGKLSGFSYYAFISYTEKDEKWAEWLQWKLEHYKIPTKVRNEHRELPSRVRPVFWYKNDLAGAHLSGAIKRELEQSKYMIVVCSPASAKKEWVNDEVCYFKDDLGRGEKIIPFIVDGEINAVDPEQECLPLPIRGMSREKELRGIDVRSYGKNKALVNIVSTLFDLRFDILWNRFRRERQRRITFYSMLVVLLAVVLFGCWDYFLRTKYEYYVDMEDCNGMPVGIIQIDNDNAKNRDRLYRFEYRRSMLQRVVYVDGNGNPQDHSNTETVDRPCIQELSYNDGDLALINCKDATGKTLYIMHLSKDKLAADLKDEDENQAANFIYSSTSVDQGKSFMQQSLFLDRILRTPSKIARYIYERDDDGYITKKMFARHNGDNDDISMDADGISGFEYERDECHRVVSIRFLDAYGDIRANIKGVAGKEYEYDKNGYLSVVKYVDEHGNLKYNEHHWAKCIDTFDDNGYCIEECVYGTDGTPCTTVQGYHKIISEHKDNSIIHSFYDIHDKPTYTTAFGEEPGGYSVLKERINEKGQITEIQFKDADGNLCFNQQHVAILKLEYDESGIISDMRYYDPKGKPCSNIYGYHHTTISHNEQGNLTEQSLFNAEEMPVQNGEGVHKFQFKYDKTGSRVEEIHTYNSDNLPMPCFSLNGAAWVKLEYQGSSKWVSAISFYTIDNKPEETSIGAKIRCERDPYGQIIAYRYYNTDNELCSNFAHSAVKEVEFNEKGQETECRFYDENENPTSQSGVYKICKSYTKNGQLEQVSCYDTLQHLCLGADGWAIQKFRYSNGAISEMTAYGTDREPIEINGVHKYIYDNDDGGFVLSVSTYDRELKPTVNSQLSAHKMVYLYDDSKRIIGNDYYDTTSDKPFVCLRMTLNKRGLQTEQASYNAQNELIESPLNNGVAKICAEYDSEDRITHQYSTDRKGKLMKTNLGIAESYSSYSDNLNELVFLDENGKPVNNVINNETVAYGMIYNNETGQRLYTKVVKLSEAGSTVAIRDANCYDKSAMHILKVIHCDDLEVRVFDAVTNKMNSYYCFDDEYDDYMHELDSIQHEVELKYGRPKLYHYFSNR